jgi:acetolactate synthase small subunit
MKKEKTESNDGHSVIVIYADDKKGLLGQLLVFFNRKNYRILNLNVSRTDISEVVVITIEAVVPAAELPILMKRLEKIIEVYRADFYSAEEARVAKVGFFRLAMAALCPSLQSVIFRYGASFSAIGNDSIVVRKTGTDNDLYELYEQLDGPHLLGFCKSCLVAEEYISTTDLYSVSGDQ